MFRAEFLLPFAEQKVQRFDDLDAVHVLDEVAVHGNDDFFIVVGDGLQGGQLPRTGFGGVHVVGHLDILFLVHFSGDEVDLFVPDFTDGDFIAPPQQLQVDDVFQNVPHVAAPVAQQIGPQAGIDDVVFPQRPQVIFPLDVKAFDLIEDVGFQESIDICGDRLHRRFAFPAVVQQALIDQRPPDGRRRGVVADVVRQEQNDLAEQKRVRDGPLFLAFATL